MNSENEKVTQITATHDKIYGLTEEGSLVLFDQNANCWALKCSAEIKTADKVNVLKKTMPTVAPITRFSNADAGKLVYVKKTKRGLFEMVTPLNVAIALIALAVLLVVFIRH